MSRPLKFNWGSIANYCLLLRPSVAAYTSWVCARLAECQPVKTT